MPPRKPNNGTDDRRVSVDREEYSALLALKEAADVRVVADDGFKGRIHDLSITCNAQARRLAEVDLVMRHQERVSELQRTFIDMMRADRPHVASLEDLSEFWRHWVITTRTLIEKQPQQRDAVAKMEPDLFRSWSLWVRDSNKNDRMFIAAGSRLEVEAQRPAGQSEVQDQAIGKLRAANTMLAARVHELEGLIDAYKNAHGKKS